MSPATINRFIELLRSVFTIANELHITSNHPLRGIKKFAEENERVRYLDTAEYWKLIQAAGNDLLKAAIALAVGTGLWRASLFDLKWSQIDLKNRVIRITRGAKGKKTIELPICGPVYDTLSSLPRGLHTDFVLHKRRSGGKFRDMRTAFQRAIEKASIEDFTWHDLRHTFASWFVQAGGDLYILQEILGHSSAKMTQRYAHLSGGYKADQIAKMESYFRQDSGYKADTGN